MKKIFGFLICTLLISVRVYAEDDIPTERIYNFDRANVASVLAEYIEDPEKATVAADRYNKLVENDENKISAVDFVDVCVVGGLKINASDGSGYTTCLEMFVKLIEMQNMDAGGFDMYCPATGNALTSITDKTQVGDVCGGTPDTYIEYGHVTVKAVDSKSNKNVSMSTIKEDKADEHKYICTCTAHSCKEGYYWDKSAYQCQCRNKGASGKCNVKDANGFCTRHILSDSFEYKNGNLPTSGVGVSDWNKKSNTYYNDKYAQMNADIDAFNRCINYGRAEGCAIRGALAVADVSSGFGKTKKYQVICNPFDAELQSHKKIEEEKDKRHKAELEQNTRYYEVCGKDKGICIDNVFTRKIIGGTQVSYATGNALVKEYARVRLGDEITCGGDSYDKNIRKSGTEYFIKCKSLKDLTKYYEFKFDDLEESKNLTANTSVYNAVWHIIYNYNIAKNSHNGYDTGTKANCDAVNATFKKICNGCGTEWRESGYIETKGKKFCYDVINIADNTTCKKSSNDLNTAFDIDPFVFCKNTHNQLKNTGNLEGLLKQYLSDKSGVTTYNIECYPQTLCYTGSGCEGTIGHGDDIKTCVVHGNKDYTVDFVFDDVNEFSKKLTKGALQSMACVVSGGTFAGQECIMANEQQCKKLAGSMKDICSGCKAPKWNTQTKLCELPDAATVTKLEKGKTVAMIVGGTIVAIGVTVITLGEGAPVAVLVLSGLDIIGGGIELGSQISIDGMAHDFLLKSIKCQDANCAERILKEDLQEMANIMNDMTDPEINATDTEFARLVGLIPQDSDFYKRIIEQSATLEANQKGFFDPEGWNAVQVWRAVGIGLQLSSLGSGFITKIVSSSRFANKFPKMQKALTKEVKLVSKRGAIRQALDEEKIVSALNGKEIEIPETQLAATVLTNDGKRSRLVRKTGYTVIDELDNWAVRNGGELFVQYDESIKSTKYIVGVQDVAMSNIEQWLKANRIPYMKQKVDGGYYIIIEENKLEAAGFSKNINKVNQVNNVSQNATNTVNTAAVERAANIITSEKSSVEYLGFTFSRDDRLTKFVSEYADDVRKATTASAEKEALLKYHQKVVDYLATKFNRAKTLNVAQQRRRTYLNIIANDRELSDKALKWKDLSGAEKQDFLQTLANKFSRTHCNGHSCSVDVTWNVPWRGSTDYANGGNITINLSSGPSLTSGHRFITVSPNASLDDAMLSFAHEHAHSITLNAPSQSSIDKQFIGMAIVHGEDDLGETGFKLFGEKLVSKNGNYQKLLTEQEAFLVGETVSANFTSDLKMLLRR